MSGYGEQFDASRFAAGQVDETMVVGHLTNAFDAHHVIPVEPNETYDNFAAEKSIHQIIDYTGVDYLIDTFDQPAFGVNHRTHSPTESQLRLDLRADTGTSAPSELEKLRHAEWGDLVPKYASRMKQSADGIEWFRVVELKQLVDAITDGGLTPNDEWTDPDGGVTAWYFNYDLLRSMGLVVYDSSRD